MHTNANRSEEELHVVPPEPVEVTLENVPVPLATPRGREDPHNYLTRTVGLLRTVQRWSALPLLAFATVHVTAVVVVPALCGPEAGDAAVSISRDLYQTPLGETILALSAGAHLCAGIALQIARRLFTAKHNHGEPWWRLRFQPVRLSGWILTVLLAGHVWKLRWRPFLVDADSAFVDSRYLAWLLAAEPASALLGLTALVAAAVFHAGAALPAVLTALGSRLRPRSRAVRWAVLGLTGLAAVALARVATSRAVFPAPLARRYALYAAWF